MKDTKWQPDTGGYPALWTGCGKSPGPASGGTTATAPCPGSQVAVVGGMSLWRNLMREIQHKSLANINLEINLVSTSLIFYEV